MKCIYLRTNIINGKQYVGQANDFERRESEWKWGDTYTGGIIDKAKMKYGVENFKSEILKECQTQDELNFWEQYYIKELNTKYPNGYNLTDGGGGMSGFKHSEEHNKKMSKVLKGRHLSEKTEYKKGYIMSQEIKNKISESKKGQEPWNKGTKGIMKAWNKGVPMSEEQKVKISKKVYQYTLDGKLVKVWDSTCECGRNGFSQGHIGACCRGERKTHKGYKWSYTKKEDIN